MNLFANARTASPFPTSNGKISLYFPAKQGNTRRRTGSLMTASTAKHFDWFLSVPNVQRNLIRFECSGHHPETAQVRNAAWVQPSLWR